MSDPSPPTKHDAHPAMESRSAATFGFWIALATGIATLATFAIAVATPPLSGQLCQQNCFLYPYLDIAERFPRAIPALSKCT